MNVISSGTTREVAKYSMDVSKLTATGAFITPCFSSTSVDAQVIGWRAFVAILAFFLGLTTHRIADHMEGKD